MRSRPPPLQPLPPHQPQRPDTAATRHQIDLKEKIDTYSDETIESINNAQINCQKLAKEVNELSKDFEDSKIKLNELINEFDTLKMNTNFEAIKLRLSELKSKFNVMLTEFKNSLINDKEYTFQFEEIQISNFFGKFKEVK